MSKICIVEDDISIARELSILLSNNGFEPVTLSDFSNPVTDVMEAKSDLILLDLNLPGHDGILLCREIRAKSQTPIIVLTSRTGEVDEVMCMRMGADDFIAKPYSSHVLLAHIEALLRRVKAVSIPQVEYQGIALDSSSMEVVFEGLHAPLTKNEMKILQLLLIHAPQCVSRQNLMCELWSSDEFVDDNTLTVNVNRLRQTLASVGVDRLVTHRGRGYSIQ